MTQKFSELDQQILSHLTFGLSSLNINFKY